MSKVTHNFTQSDFDQMLSDPSESANEIGKRVPYHLQYLRDGKVNFKPEEKKDAQKEENSPTVSAD